MASLGTEESDCGRDLAVLRSVVVVQYGTYIFLEGWGGGGGDKNHLSPTTDWLIDVLYVPVFACSSPCLLLFVCASVCVNSKSCPMFFVKCTCICKLLSAWPSHLARLA